MSETHSLETLDPEAKSHVDAWLNGAYDESTKEKIRTLLRDNLKEINDAFYKTLSFGTGGMRGIMGIGSNRMNLYTVQSATQGLANYLQKQFPSQDISVFISYDSRHNSKEFAHEAAKVMAGNGINTYLTSDLRPSPYVSFGCRFKRCQAAIMITASHNPPEYNGYKVYWSDGAQILPPHDAGIVAEVKKITDISQIKKVSQLKHPLIEIVDDEVDAAYLHAISELPFYPKENQTSGAKLNIVYSSLHGTGITLIPRALKMWGFYQLHFVDSQIQTNGDFPTVHSPNPEEPAALQLGIETMQKLGADIFLATDPDTDRVGVAVMHNGNPYIFNGNQIACLCLDHILKALTSQNKLPLNAAFVKTIVTTELFKEITKHYETHCFDVLTGFKYIAQIIHEWEKDENGFKFIFGGEESFGYLLGTFVRDKDAVIASCLIAEVALQAKLQGKTLVDHLYHLYELYGVYSEALESVDFEDNKEGKDAMQKAMQFLRKGSFKEIKGVKIVAVDDYSTSLHTNLVSGETSSLFLPKSDVLIFYFEDGSKLMVRPSGTEPKVKIYCSILEKGDKTPEEGEKRGKERAKTVLSAMKQLLTSNTL